MGVKSGHRVGARCPECGERSITFGSGRPFKASEPFSDEILTSHRQGNPFRCGWCGADLPHEPEILADSATAKPALPARE